MGYRLTTIVSGSYIAIRSRYRWLGRFTGATLVGVSTRKFSCSGGKGVRKLEYGILLGFKCGGGAGSVFGVRVYLGVGCDGV